MTNCDPLASTQSDLQSGIDHEDGCEQFDGQESRWRERVIAKAYIELGIDQPALSWPTPTCGTPLCLTFRHITWEAPKKLAYPPGVCVYCGMSANTKDHLLPRTWTGESVRRHVLTVPACYECNSAINDRYIPAINDRRKQAQLYIARKNKKLLRMPDWTQEAINELGPTLRSAIERGVHDLKIIRARLGWPEEPDYDLRAMQMAGIENPYEIGLLTELKKTA